MGKPLSAAHKAAISKALKGKKRGSSGGNAAKLSEAKANAARHEADRLQVASGRPVTAEGKPLRRASRGSGAARAQQYRDEAHAHDEYGEGRSREQIRQGNAAMRNERIRSAAINRKHSSENEEFQKGIARRRAIQATTRRAR